MSGVSFEIPTRPLPAPRPRVTRWGAYNDPKYTEYKKAIAIIAKQQKFYSENALKMSITFIFPYPKSWSKKKIDLAYFHTSRPDLDNLIKGVKDALNDICYKDDSQITQFDKVTKIWGDTERIDITLEEI